MQLSRPWVLLAGVAAVAIPLALNRAHGSDHADTPTIAALPGADVTDVFAFPAPANPSKLVLVMDIHPLIPTGQGNSVDFDPNVLYQFKFDSTGSGDEDKVLQFWFTGSGATQMAHVAGPAAPLEVGTVTRRLTADSATGAINTVFTTTTGIKVFTGAREDPFFFDLSQFFTIFPDRATPITGTPVADPNVPKDNKWRPVGTAKDYLAGLNVLSMVVELPKAMIGTGKVGIWCTTSR